jgi:hypothetical protein
VIRALRWLLAPCTAVVGYLVSVLGSALIATWIKRLWCPPAEMVSGACIAPWYHHAELAGIAVAVGLGAALFVALPTLVAPSHRSRVAWLAYAVGAVGMAGFVAQVGLSFWPPWLSAMLAGGVTAWSFRRST